MLHDWGERDETDAVFRAYERGPKPMGVRDWLLMPVAVLVFALLIGAPAFIAIVFQ